MKHRYATTAIIEYLYQAEQASTKQIQAFLKERYTTHQLCMNTLGNLLGKNSNFVKIDENYVTTTWTLSQGWTEVVEVKQKVIK